MKANGGQCLNPDFSASNYSAVVLTLLDRTLVNRRYPTNNICTTHLQLSILSHIGVNKIA